MWEVVTPVMFYDYDVVMVMSPDNFLFYFYKDHFIETRKKMNEGFIQLLAC